MVVFQCVKYDKGRFAAGKFLGTLTLTAMEPVAKWTACDAARVDPLAGWQR